MLSLLSGKPIESFIKQGNLFGSMLGLLTRFKTRKEPLDFAQIVGSCTEDGRKAGASWDNVNVADGSNQRAQELS